MLDLPEVHSLAVEEGVGADGGPILEEDSSLEEEPIREVEAQGQEVVSPIQRCRQSTDVLGWTRRPRFLMLGGERKGV